MNYLVELTLLAAIWGGSFLFMRIATPEFGPFALIFVRAAVAAVTLFPFILHAKQVKVIVQNWLLFLWIGVTAVAIPFTLFSYVTLNISAGNTSLLNATTPIFSSIIAWLWLKESLRLPSIIGLVLGFVGVFLLSTAKGGNQLENLLPVGAALVATSCYAYGSCFARLKMGQFRSLTAAAGGQIFAAIVLLPFCVFFAPPKFPSVLSWSSAIALGVLCTAVALILYFHLLKSYGVAKTVSVTYLIPVFGILWGVIFIEETVSLKMLLGGAMILLGVALTASSKGKAENKKVTVTDQNTGKFSR